MRTTVEFDPDVSRAIERLRHETGMGVSEAVNALIRRGLSRPAQRSRFRQRSERIGLRADVSNIAETLQRLEGS